MRRLRYLCVPLLTGFLVGVGVQLVWPPLEAQVSSTGNILNHPSRFDSSSNPIFTAVAVNAASQTTGNLARRIVNFDASNNLMVAINGGTITPNIVCLDAANQDTGISRTAAAVFSFGNCAGSGTATLNAGSFVAVSDVSIGAARFFYWAGRTELTSPADGQLLIRNYALTAGIGLDAATDGTLKLRNTALTAGTGNFDIGAKLTAYNAVSTAGWGIPATYGYGDVAAATNTGTASIATYTVGAADGTFEVGCNILITTSTTFTFSCDVTYTDEGNTARTLVLPVEGLAGTFLANGLITNTTGAGPYESAVMTIRAKAATAITVRTSSGGTFTTVVYNARGVIKQVG